MSRITLNKTSLKRERDQLNLYEKYLPSLDLKRQQFLFEIRQAREALNQTEKAVAALVADAEEWLPLLANMEIDVSGLVKVDAVELDEENLLGVRIPTLKDIAMHVAEYSMLAKPHWVDTLVDTIKEMIQLPIRLQVEEQRLDLLNRALRTITQRVNLFEKVLIPATQKNIRKIQVFLGDTERASVVRSKIAKAKQLAEGV